MSKVGVYALLRLSLLLFGPDAGMDEHIIAQLDDVLEPAQEIQMRRRHPLAHHRQQFVA